MHTCLSRLLCSLMAVLCLVPSALALPQQHEHWWKTNEAYRVMYDRYDLGLTRAYQALPQERYDLLVRDNETNMSLSVKADTAAGKDEALAHAQAYARRVLVMENIMANTAAQQEGKTSPLEGFYRLDNAQGMEGYLTISRDGENGYALEIAAWRTDAPESFAWTQAQAAVLSNTFTTTSVFRPDTAVMDKSSEIQIRIAISNGTAVVQTTQAFRKGGYAHFSRGETLEARQTVLDGRYSFVKP